MPRASSTHIDAGTAPSVARSMLIAVFRDGVAAVLMNLDKTLGSMPTSAAKARCDFPVRLRYDARFSMRASLHMVQQKVNSP